MSPAQRSVVGEVTQESHLAQHGNIQYCIIKQSLIRLRSPALREQQAVLWFASPAAQTLWLRDLGPADHGEDLRCRAAGETGAGKLERRRP